MVGSLSGEDSQSGYHSEHKAVLRRWESRSMLRADSVRDGHHNLKKGRDGLAAGNISI